MRVTLNHVENIAKNIKTFWFEPSRNVRYSAGQFIELTIPHENPDKRGIKRWFTLSSSPSEKFLSITTKHATENGSSFKEKLFSLNPGDEVIMSEPMGDFVLPKDKSIPLVFIAGGIGITPIRSMIKWLHDNQEQRSVHLIYAANNIDDLAFRPLFNEYGAPTDIILSTPPSKWQGRSGHANANTVLEIAPDVDKKLYFISGPEQMVEALERDLKSEGVDRRRIIGDFFPGYAGI